MIKKLNKKIKKLDMWDIALTKLGAASIVLFIITIWKPGMQWVQSMNPWWFLIAGLVFASRPLYKIYQK